MVGKKKAKEYAKALDGFPRLRKLEKRMERVEHDIRGSHIDEYDVESLVKSIWKLENTIDAIKVLFISLPISIILYVATCWLIVEMGINGNIQLFPIFLIAALLSVLVSVINWGVIEAIYYSERC